MPRLRGYSQSTGAAAAQGAFDTLPETMQLLIKRYMQQEQDKVISQREAENQRGSLVEGLSSRIAEHPDQASMMLQGAKANPRLKDLDLSSLQPPQINLASPVLNKLNTAKTPLDLPADIGTALQAAGADATPGVSLNNTAQFGSQADYANVPELQNQAMNVATSRMGQMEQEKQTGMGDAYNKAYMTTSGSGQAEQDLNDQNFEGNLGQLGRKTFTTAYNTKDAQDQPEFLNTEVNTAGKKAGAEAAARFPWEEKLKSATNAGELRREKDFYDYQKDNPKLSATQISKREQANTAHELITSRIVPEMQTLEQQNLLGPLRGRIEDVLSSKIKISDLYKDPAQAQLVTRFLTDGKLLSSLVANVHGGARAVSSKGTLEYFKSIFNGVGDGPILKGQLGSVDDLMNRYAHNPDMPELFPLSGLPTEDQISTYSQTGAAGTVNPTVDPVLEMMRKKQAGRRQ